MAGWGKAQERSHATPQHATAAFYGDGASGTSAFHLAVELMQHRRELGKAFSQYPLIESGLKHERHANSGVPLILSRYLECGDLSPQRRNCNVCVAIKPRLVAATSRRTPNYFTNRNTPLPTEGSWKVT